MSIDYEYSDYGNDHHKDFDDHSIEISDLGYNSDPGIEEAWDPDREDYPQY